MLTAWDSLSGAVVQAAGADAVLVGDSLGMVALGHTTTLPVTLDQMLHHTQAVARGFSSAATEHPLLISDLPFLSYQCGEDLAVAAAGRRLKESPAAADAKHRSMGSVQIDLFTPCGSIPAPTAPRPRTAADHQS